LIGCIPADYFYLILTCLTGSSIPADFFFYLILTCFDR
jgi:hypothetical protein